MFNVLLSCMHQKDFSIIEDSQLNNVPTVIVNQCNCNNIVSEGMYTMISTTTRGLSVSRNLAIQNSKAEICLLADDDETFVPCLEEKIMAAYRNIKDADIIIFKMINYPNRFRDKIKKLKKYDCLKVSSYQISFRKSAIIEKNIAFDVKLGAGSGNGASEENKFLLDCYKKGLKIYYCPIEIALLKPNQSTWFNGFDEKFFFNHGKTTRYILGLTKAVLYGFYYLLFKHKVYKKDISMWKANKYLFKGIFAKGIDSKL